MTHVSFDISTEDRSLIHAIADRAFAIAHSRGQWLSRMDTEMDIAAVHANGNPLQLAALLDADAFNFTHDVFGIIRYVNRETGKLGQFFSPRFTVRK